MLVTPSPSLSVQPVSSSEKNESSASLTLPRLPPPTRSKSDTGHIGTRPRAISSSYTPSLLTNGPQNNRLLSTSQSRLPQLPDQDWFYPSSSRPSVHYLTPTSAKTPDTGRRVSCPVPRDNNKKDNRFRFPSSITSSIRDALTPTTPTANPNIYTNDLSHISRASLPGSSRPSSIFLPIANPVAAAALMEDDESTLTDEQPNKSISPSPMDTPKSSMRFHRTPTECSTSVGPSHNTNSKVILNVGGVRHEGILLSVSQSNINIYL